MSKGTTTVFYTVEWQNLSGVWRHVMDTNYAPQQFKDIVNAVEDSRARLPSGCTYRVMKHTTIVENVKQERA